MVVLKCFCDDKMIIYNISIYFINWDNCMYYILINYYYVIIVIIVVFKLIVYDN